MGVPYDEVQVSVFARLLTNEGIDTPTAVQPDVGLRRPQPPKDLEDIGCFHGRREPASSRTAEGLRRRGDVLGRRSAAAADQRRSRLLPVEGPQGWPRVLARRIGPRLTR